MNSSLKALFGTILIIAGAYMSIDLPLLDIPLTFQSMFILLVPVIFGLRAGIMAITIYLVLGVFGMPVFSGGSGGWEKFIGASGGFLIGFLITGTFAGIMAETRTNFGFWSFFQLFLGSHLFLFGLGMVGIVIYTVSSQVPVNFSILPFLPGIIIKSGAAAVIALGVQNSVSTKGNSLPQST